MNSSIFVSVYLLYTNKSNFDMKITLYIVIVIKYKMIFQDLVKSQTLSP